MKTIIIGLGNPILTDDGVGIWVAREVQKHLAKDQGTGVEEASLGGLGLMEMMVGYDRVILVDALPIEGGKPGAIHRLTEADLRQISQRQPRASAHTANLATTLATGRQMGLLLPREIIIFAVEVENVHDFGNELSTAVATAIPKVVTAVLTELEEDKLRGGEQA